MFEFDAALVRDIIKQILVAIDRIDRRMEGVVSAGQFVASDAGIDKLDAICMMLVAIGESCKQLDRITNGILFESQQDVDWKGVKGIRDVISHHYFDVNEEMVFLICRNNLAGVRKAFESMLEGILKPDA